jgi:hypothetical protein
VTVPDGETLTIEPGVVVFAQSWHALTVSGRLVAEGTEESPILFTATPAGPGEPGWKGIRFVDADDGSVLSFCTIENGKTTAGNPFDRGGGVYCQGSSPLIERCTIRNNRASTAGGGIYGVDSAPVLVDNLVTNNLVGYLSSGAGGGVAFVDSSPQLLGNRITGNEVQAFGGFVAAHGLGGGISLSGCSATLERNLITGNVVHAEGNVGTASRGGGLYNGGFASMIMVDRNTVSGNEATVYSSPQDGAGLYLDHGSVTVVNTIVHGQNGGGIFFDADAAATVGYSDFHANSGGDFHGSVPGGLGDIVTTNANGDPADAGLNIFLDPLFVDEAGGDLDLQPESPCVDAGDPVSPRDPDGTVADIGAVPVYQEGPTPGDLNGDGRVDVTDLVMVILGWGDCPPPCPPLCSGDANLDCSVDVQDLEMVILTWTF